MITCTPYGPRQCSESLHSLQWRHNERHDVTNHGCLDCLLSRLFRRRSKKTSKLLVTGLYEGNPPVAGGFPSQTPVTRKLFPFKGVIMSSPQLKLRDFELSYATIHWIIGRKILARDVLFVHQWRQFPCNIRLDLTFWVRQCVREFCCHKPWMPSTKRRMFVYLFHMLFKPRRLKLRHNRTTGICILEAKYNKYKFGSTNLY